MLMSKSRLEKFLYALYSLDSSDLPTPLSRIEELYKCLVTDEEAPTFEPLSRVEKYLMTILGAYDVDSLPNPLSRVEVLLYKLATGDDNLDDVKSFLSEHEELLAEIIRNGGVGGNIDIEYVLYTLSTKHNTLYNTAEKPVKSAILKGNTKYRDIDTGDILDTFDETKNLELVSVKMPVLKTVGKNLFDPKYKNPDNYIDRGFYYSMSIDLIEGKEYKMSFNVDCNIAGCYFTFSSKPQPIDDGAIYSHIIMNGSINDEYYVANKTNYICFFSDVEDKFSALSNLLLSLNNVQLEEGSTATTYEPFKSNILTTSEEVVLRGIGEVKDELDLVIGEVIKKLGKVTFNGSENWQDADNALSNTHRFQANLSTFKNSSILLNDGGFNNITSGTSHIDTKHIQISGMYIFIRTLRSEIDSLDDFKSFLSSNPLTIIGELAVGTASETVDISTVDQDGNDTKLSTFNDITHVTLSSEGLIPEAELEVATKNKEVLSTMSLEMNDISTTQNALQETSDIQSENVDSTMIATTEIYEELL